MSRDIANPAARLRLRYSVGNYQVHADILNDANALIYTPWVTITDGPHAFEIDWKAVTASGTNDGFVTLWIDDIQAGTQAGIDNDTRCVDYAALGPSGIPTGSRGTLFFSSLTPSASIPSPPYFARSRLSISSVICSPLFKSTAGRYPNRFSARLRSARIRRTPPSLRGL